jgi:predicted nuclease of predicted toxin-antitoxin system
LTDKTRGSSDEKFLARAQREERILITFESDFGELAFRSKLPASSGIILFRITAPSSQYIADLAAGAIASRSDGSDIFRSWKIFEYG